MLLILTAAMLPLSFVALLTSIDMVRSASLERREAARTVTKIYAAQAEAMLKSRLSGAEGLLLVRQSPENLCDALRRQADLHGSISPPAALFDPSGRKICQSWGEPITDRARTQPGSEYVWLDVANKRLIITAARAGDGFSVKTVMPVTALNLNIRSEDGQPLLRLAIRQGRAEVVLLTRPTNPPANMIRVSETLADGRLAIVADYALAEVQARTAVLIVMPILMGVAAAFFGWLVVSRVLLQPINQVKRSIDDWQGTQQPFQLPRISTPSLEIRELAESFASAASRIYDHERELEEGLRRQTKLTREVHHRVKNNLQVVSSLINLHARGAQGEVAAAYGAIQRRVDALAVVYRNHYAEIEESRGVSMRALAGELASALRASAPPSAAGMPIALNVIDVYVTQDVAVPIAFLITEVVELLMYRNPQGSVLISLEMDEERGRATLGIEAIGMSEQALDDYADITRFDRVVTGIARQFRSPLHKDLRIGRFEIQIAVIA